MKKKVAVIDYGMGNIQSIARAFEISGVAVEVTDKIDRIESSDVVVLPGVGSFGSAVTNLKRISLWNKLPRIILTKPFLGICLGLQLLFEKSEEGKTAGLGIFKGEVKKFDFSKFSGYEFQELKIPHMGWNQVGLKVKGERAKIFRGIADNSYFYFVHSYYVVPEDKKIVTTATNYGFDFCSSIFYKNIFACQFHPEKSGHIGLKLIKNFLDLYL